MFWLFLCRKLCLFKLTFQLMTAKAYKADFKFGAFFVSNIVIFWLLTFEIIIWYIFNYIEFWVCRKFNICENFKFLETMIIYSFELPQLDICLVFCSVSILLHNKRLSLLWCAWIDICRQYFKLSLQLWECNMEASMLKCMCLPKERLTV